MPKKDPTYERIERALYKDHDESALILTSREMEIKARMMLCVSKRMESPLIEDSELVNFLMHGCGGQAEPVSKSQAYSGDAKGAAAALDKIGKYTRSDKEDDALDYSQLIPPSFEPSDDVTLLEGLEPIDNLEQERQDFRSQFKNILARKAMDITSIDDEEEDV